MATDTADLDGDLVDIRRLDYAKEKKRFSGMAVPSHVEEASRKLLRSFGLAEHPKPAHHHQYDAREIRIHEIIEELAPHDGISFGESL